MRAYMYSLLDGLLQRPAAKDVTERSHSLTCVAQLNPKTLPEAYRRREIVCSDQSCRARRAKQDGIIGSILAKTKRPYALPPRDNPDWAPTILSDPWHASKYRVPCTGARSHPSLTRHNRECTRSISIHKRSSRRPTSCPSTCRSSLKITAQA